MKTFNDKSEEDKIIYLWKCPHCYKINKRLYTSLNEIDIECCNRCEKRSAHNVKPENIKNKN